MQGKIYLDIRENQMRKGGYFPLTCEITGGSKQKPFVLKMKFTKNEWDFNKELPKDKTKLLIVKRKRNLLSSLLLDSLSDSSITFDYIKKALKGELKNEEEAKGGSKEIDFFKFGYELANEKRKVISSKGVPKEGNAENYETALNQLKKNRNEIYISDIDYKLLTELKNVKLSSGKKKSTINTYLKDLKAIYNEGLRRYKLKYDHNPFEGIFKGITVKKNRTKKRNLSKESIRILECFNGNLAKGQQLAIDLFLVQFYSGGQDLIDIYYLERKQISKKDRVYFTRGKLEDGGYEFDVKIFDKSKRVLNRFVPQNNFIVSGRKDHVGYKNFRSRVNKNLKIVKENYNEHVKNIEAITKEEFHKLELLPLDDNITTKVARHTFSTIGNRMYVEPDLLRSLMGHERDDVDTIYKDVYPEKERDKFHAQIIDTSDIDTQEKFVYQLEYFNNDGFRDWKYLYFDKEQKPEELVDEITLKKYSEPRYFKKIFLIKK